MADKSETLKRHGVRELWRKDDWLAVWFGFLILAVVAAGLALKLPAWKWTTFADLGKVLGGANLVLVLPVLAVLAAIGLVASILLGRNPLHYLAGFPIVLLLALVAFLIAGNAVLSKYGIEFVFWGLALGLLISNTVGTPAWLKVAANTELYIKIGLVLLGAEMLMGTLLKAGALGMLQALLVITAVWYVCYWISRRLGLDHEFGAILATGVSVCGVSAAIAAGGAIKGDPKKVSHTISLVLIVAVPMLVLEPILARAMGLPGAVAGAWLGGTIDTTGAVTAAGSVMGKGVMDMAVVVKLAQNALIGIVAFLLSLWSTFRKKDPADRPRASEIWYRFPKFVLGFIAASLVFSLAMPPETATGITKITSGLRGYFFGLAFVSIGLETRIKDLVAMGGGKPALAFLGGQAFNLVWTLLIAFLVFGGVLFPALAL